MPENAAGDFYVEDGVCLRSCIVHEIIPDLMNDQLQHFESCYFSRQPCTNEEVGRAVHAICSCCVGALRYGGSNQQILESLSSLGESDRCDQLGDNVI